VKLKHPEARIGLALGGGFARGIAHVGVLRVFEQHRIPLSAVAGVSAGSIVAAAFASGADSYEIEKVARAMTFKDVARWRLSKLGLAGSERMIAFLQRLLKCFTFEEMKIPLAVVATDLNRAVPIIFRDRGDVILPVRASCSYPGLFLPMPYDGGFLVDGAMSMEVPTRPLRAMGATHVIAVTLPMQTVATNPANMFSVVNRCFQIMQRRAEREWLREANLVIHPQVGDLAWDSFPSAEELVDAGKQAALAVLPRIRSWLRRTPPSADPMPAAEESAG
jgi:NTE family protein